MKKIFLIAAALSFTQFVFAADWVEITHKSYLDFSSIKTGEYGYIYAWQKILNQGDFTPINGKKVHFLMAYTAYDCGNDKSKNQALVVYGLDGEVIKSNDYGGSWSYIIPETSGEAFYKIICKYASRK